jgi:multisubunit Na+/H+ antiporter MnhC subunit
MEAVGLQHCELLLLSLQPQIVLLLQVGVEERVQPALGPAGVERMALPLHPVLALTAVVVATVPVAAAAVTTVELQASTHQVKVVEVKVGLATSEVWTQGLPRLVLVQQVMGTSLSGGNSSTNKE